MLGGEPSPAVAPAREAPASMCLAMVLLAVVCLGAGVLVPFFRESVLDAACQALLGGIRQAAVAVGG